MIKSVSDLRQVVSFLWVLQFPLPIKLTPWYSCNIVESGDKHHNPLAPVICWTRLKQKKMAYIFHTIHYCYCLYVQLILYHYCLWNMFLSGLINLKKKCNIHRAAGRWFSPGTPLSSTNKTDRHDIAENIVESGVKHHKPSQKNISVHCYIRNQTDLKTSYQTSFISKLKYSNWKGTSCIQNCNWNRNTLHCLKQNVGLKLFILRARCSTAYRFDGFALQY